MTTETVENYVPNQQDSPVVPPFEVEHKVFNSGPCSYRTLPAVNNFRPDSMPTQPAALHSASLANNNSQPDPQSASSTPVAELPPPTVLLEPHQRPPSGPQYNSNSDSLNLYATSESLSSRTPPPPNSATPNSSVQSNSLHPPPMMMTTMAPAGGTQFVAPHCTPPQLHPGTSNDSSNLSNPGSGGSDKEANVEQRPANAAGTPAEGKPTARKRKNAAEGKQGTPKHSRADRKIADFMTKVQSSPKHSASRHLNGNAALVQAVSLPSTSEKMEIVAEPMDTECKVDSTSVTETPMEYIDYNKRLKTMSDTIDNLKDQIRRGEARCQEQREVIRELLIEKSDDARKAARDKSLASQQRLGHFKPCRIGDTFKDQWQEGSAFQEITKQLEKINQEKNAMSNRRKKKPTVKKSLVESLVPGTSASGSLSDSSLSALSASRPSTAAAGDDVFRAPGDSDEWIILKQQAEQLRDEEKELLMEREKLERERNLHIREMKRIQCEDQSRFKNHEALPLENKRYLLISLLGKGGFSEVWRAYDLEKNIYVACKIHHVNKEWKEEKKANYVKHAMREKRIHQDLKHPRIVRLLDIFTIDNDSFCTVLEYCDGNDLDFYLKQQKQLSEKDAKLIIRQVLSALRYLSEQKHPIIHYDLKPANILLQSSRPGKSTWSREIKITDFGLSKTMESSDDGESIELTSQGAGTYWYLPPETFQHFGPGIPTKISSKVDVWSVGVIFYQCLYGRRPFGHNLTQQEILEQRTILNAQQVEFPANPKVSPAAQDFIRRCLQYNKDDRADVADLLNHDLLKRN